MKDFSKKLIYWYQENKRDLPWRNTSDPYRIWLSEIILQQTRVDQGMSYYLKFIKLFPKIKTLAMAEEDEVLSAWQGLGYYSRARNLHATAKSVWHLYQGKFPDNYQELLKLKGVGPYTAAAIASFCFGAKTPVIDGNVIRVLSRLFAIEGAADTTSGKKTINMLAEKLIDPEHPGEYNQAIMEFGATHCTPHNANCPDCPFKLRCIAFKNNMVYDFPIKAKRTIVKNHWLYYFYLKIGDKFYVKKRSGKGIWKGLYDFPLIESNEVLDENEVVQQFMTQHQLKGRVKTISVSDEYLHVLTHRKLYAKFFEMEILRPISAESADLRLVNSAELSLLGIPRLIEKYLDSKKKNNLMGINDH